LAIYLNCTIMHELTNLKLIMPLFVLVEGLAFFILIDWTIIKILFWPPSCHI
jgi:hypothetical protein